MFRTLIPLLIGCFLTLATGCSSPPALNANMSDATLRASLAQHFPTGLSLDAVEANLDDLHISRENRLLYQPQDDRPQVLLARLFQPGGFWMDGQDTIVEWVDVSFVFEPTNYLSRILLFRTGMHYFNGEPVGKPDRQPAAPFQNWPAEPPPPMNPLQGAT